MHFNREHRQVCTKINFAWHFALPELLPTMHHFILTVAMARECAGPGDKQVQIRDQSGLLFSLNLEALCILFLKYESLIIVL